MFIIIDLVTLTKFVFVEIVYRCDIFYNIVNNRDFIFISIFYFML